MKIGTLFREILNESVNQSFVSIRRLVYYLLLKTIKN